MHRVHTSMRALSVLAGAALALALALPAFATTGHQSGWDIAWDDKGFQGSADECAGAGLDTGEVLWHFVQTKVPAGVADGTLLSTFDKAGEITVDSYKRAGAVLHWAIVTGEDTLQAFSSNVTSGGQLNLSHICAGRDSEGEAERPSAEPSQDPSTKPSQDPSTKPSQDPSAKPSQDPSTKPSQDPSTKPSQDPSTKPSQDPSTEPGTQTPSASPSADAAGATGTPRVTPPPTDAIGGDDTTGSSTGWLLAMAGLAALVIGLVTSRPSRRARR